MAKRQTVHHNSNTAVTMSNKPEFETSTFDELGFSEAYVRACRPNGWEVCHGAGGTTYPIRKITQ